MRRLLLASCVCAAALWSAVPVATAFDARPMYSGKLVDFQLVDTVKLDWDEKQFAAPPALGEGEKYAVLTVTLDKGKSIGLFDYKLDEQPALAMAVENNAFSPAKWQQIEGDGGVREVRLLYKVKNNLVFPLVMAYSMPTIKDSFTRMTLDLTPPVPPLPGDFAFGFLTSLDKATNLTEKLKAETKPEDLDADHITITQERDQVTGLHSHGLRVVKADGKVTWTPEPFAAYRDGRLLGVYDTQQHKLRAAGPDEAPDTLGGLAPAAPTETTPPAPEAAVPAAGTTPPAPVVAPVNQTPAPPTGGAATATPPAKADATTAKKDPKAAPAATPAAPTPDPATPAAPAAAPTTPAAPAAPAAPATPSKKKKDWGV